jgi:GT2 family glycosyltransferase/2-polyprenyl-3-methyl-5-hydroxy-6-metoxy-1,4-benzoquinol methylase
MIVSPTFARRLLADAGYTMHTEHRVWAREVRDAAPFQYSDGDEVEQRIAMAIESSDDRSVHSPELRKHQTDWPSIYHLSAARANLVRPLAPMLNGANVLEIGAGCGAITRYLGEAGARVVALEGSARRASIAALRCADLAEVEVVHERFDAFEPTERFDVVTLIGVLEYARMYTGGADPIQETLKRAHDLLTDDGVLVIAIENQLGLKYFAGMPEDHIGRAMVGIQDEYTDHSVATFGKAELERRLGHAGYVGSEFALPFPDYKLPQNVVLPAGLDDSRFDASTLGAQSARADRQLRSGTLFSMSRAFGVLGRNGLLADMANSFLILARKSKSSPTFATIAPDVLAEQFAVERDTAFIKGARFRAQADGITVERYPLSPGHRNPSQLLGHVIESEAYVEGRRWADVLDRIVTRDGWTLDEVTHWFQTWLKALRVFLATDESITAETLMPGASFDAMPGNLIVKGDETHFFDLEWSLHAPITVGYLGFRALKLSLGQITAVSMPQDASLLHTDTLIRVVMRRAGLIVTSTNIRHYLDTEAAFVAEVQGRLDVDLPYDSYRTDTLGVLPDISLLLQQHTDAIANVMRETAALAFERRNGQEDADSRAQHEVDGLVERAHTLETMLDATTSLRSDLQSRVDTLRTENRELSAAADTYRNELQLMKHSLSWRLTGPLRRVNRIAGRLRGGLRRRLASSARRVYQAAPISYRQKRALKGVLFRAGGPLLRQTSAYQRWDAERRASQAVAPFGSPYGASRYLAGDAALANPLWQADGIREWAEYTGVRQGIEAGFAEIRRTRQAKQLTCLDFSKMDPRKVAADIRLPAVEAPRVTILVPVYNHLSTTLECLASIASAIGTGGITFEVLVANDASTDESADVLGGIANLRVFNQPRNLGFLLNCNTAAKRARGEFLVLLNNDVQVTRGWLDALIAAIQSDPRIGAVGPRIVYPNGWLQEAGIRLHRDGSAEMLGLNDQADLPRYAFTRDVDYCSGACLVLRRADFERLGGFDEGFAPAYCEDSDLCMRLREEGRRIVYCAEAEVIHQLSTTSDAMPSDYKLSCVARNLDRFADKWREQLDTMNEVRTIAFYLPQFHPIAENDVWWGAGFTEWTNVSKARPNFVGHYQPRLPSDLGYYDLRLSEVMEKQAELARRYGIGGFCYYYYWFAGHRLLERPIEQMLETGRPDFPFCLCWANENWTRRWDGQENEILMAQKHSDEDDLAVIHDLMRYFRSPNYIKINGKPLILVYRITLFPDFARTARIWREECRRAGIGEIYITQVESFELVAAGHNPQDMGCDAAVEFPPQGMANPITVDSPLLNPDFKGTVADYRDIAVRYATRELPAYKRFMGVMPGWDNTARRQDTSFSFSNASPGAFQAWMEATVTRTKQQFSGDERLVFINAWNEWAEGAYLEPDRRFGHTFLEAHRNALDADYLSRKDKYSLG